MTDPQDPFAAPGDQPTPPPGYGAPDPSTPAYGAPAYGAPAGAWGTAPAYAPWGVRVVAALIDVAIIIAAQIVVSAASYDLAQLVALGIEVYFAYLVGTRGQSPGKQVMKIKIVRDADGQLLGFGTAVLRWLAHLVDVFTLGLGFLWPLWDKKRQTFADKIVGSVSVRV